MIRAVRLTPSAQEDFIDRFVMIGADSSDSAERFRTGLLETLQFLAQSPNAGRPYRMRARVFRGMRAWPVGGFPKILIFYQPDEEGNLIVRRILHGAMDLRRELKRR
jgi:plasmid stabilization system protein ParE